MPLEIPGGIGSFRLACEERDFKFVLTGKDGKVSCTRERQGSGEGPQKIALTNVPHSVSHYFNRETAKLATTPEHRGPSLALGSDPRNYLQT